jgi:predicted transcriptional regulator
MALSRKKATTIALDPEDDRRLSRAARERGVSRSEFIRQHLALVLEQYRRPPRPRSAGVVRALNERGDGRSRSDPITQSFGCSSTRVTNAFSVRARFENSAVIIRSMSLADGTSVTGAGRPRARRSWQNSIHRRSI